MRRNGPAKVRTNIDVGLRDKAANPTYEAYVAWMKHSGIRDV